MDTYVLQYTMKNEIELDIKDICLEINDDGFETKRCRRYINDIGVYPSITIKKHDERAFDYKEVEDVVERIKEYLSYHGYYTEVIKNGGRILEQGELMSLKPSQVYDIILGFLKNEIRKSFYNY